MTAKKYALVMSDGTVRAYGTIYEIQRATGLKRSTLYWYTSAQAARRRGTPVMVEAEEAAKVTKPEKLPKKKGRRWRFYGPDGELRCEGTVEEIAARECLAESTVRSYTSPSMRAKTWMSHMVPEEEWR